LPAFFGSANVFPAFFGSARRAGLKLGSVRPENSPAKGDERSAAGTFSSRPLKLSRIPSLRETEKKAGQEDLQPGKKLFFGANQETEDNRLVKNLGLKS
jgi:hypothetical protein